MSKLRNLISCGLVLGVLFSCFDDDDKLTMPAPVLEIVDVIDTGFKVTWKEVPGADSYYIEVATNEAFKGALYSQVFGRLVLGRHEHHVVGLTPKTTYYVRGASGKGGKKSVVYSKVIQKTTTKAKIPAPSITVTNVREDGCSLTWRPVSSADRYSLDIATDDGFTAFVDGYNKKTVNMTTEIVRGLASNKKYYVRARSLKDDDEEASSVNSDVKEFTTRTELLAPTGLGIKSSSRTSTGFTFEWTPSTTADVDFQYITVVKGDDLTDESKKVGSLFESQESKTLSEKALSSLSSGTQYTVQVCAGRNTERKCAEYKQTTD